MGDVAKVEIGSESYSEIAPLQWQDAAGIGISLSSGANALSTRNAVEAKLKELEPKIFLRA